MSETISQIPAGASGLLSDLIPLTQGSSGPGTGITYKMTTAKVLSSTGVVYAGDPAYGVVANNSTDDTAAWTAALNAAFIKGTWVVAPYGISVVTSISIPSGVGIIGRSVDSGLIGTVVGGSTIRGTSVTSPTIIMNGYTQLSNIQIAGNSSQPCVQTNSANCQLENVDLYGGSVGAYGNYVQAKIMNSRIHECGIGIFNPSDWHILGCTINNCTNIGISLQPGASYNVIAGNRIEWSTNANLQIDGTGGGACRGNIISGNKFDAAGANNLVLKNCRATTVSGNDFGRAGRNQTGTLKSATDASIQIANSTGVVISGNSSWVYGNFDGTGYVGPYWAVFDSFGNTNCLISSNILAYHNNAATVGAATDGPINSTGTFNLAASLNVSYWATNN